MTQSYRTIELEVIRWAEARGIMDKSDPKTQCLKFASEAGELCDAVAKGNLYDTIDAVGDTVVTLILLCALLDIDLVDCLDHAYGVIAKRKGQMVNGIFVKEAA
jgi:NTP pyrophosphatase (non-canonical NTP hydrolase)